MGGRRDAERQRIRRFQVENPDNERPNILTRIKTAPSRFWQWVKTVPSRLWHFLCRNRTALSEFSIVVLTVVAVVLTALSIWYTVQAIKLAEEGISLAKVAIDIGQTWSKTSYENAVLNTWSAVQAACKENQTIFPVNETMFKDWSKRPGVKCTSKERCVCEVLDPSAYVGDQILTVYYPFLNNCTYDECGAQ